MLRWRVAGNDETRRRPRLRRRPRSRWRTGPATSPSTATRATTARRASTDSTSRSSGGRAYGRGRRRRDGGDADRVARRIAARRRVRAGDSSDSDSDSDSDDATPLEPLEGDRARRVFLDAAGDDIDDADGIHVENENDARYARGSRESSRFAGFSRDFFPETPQTRARGDFPARRRAKQTRLDAWAGREGGASRRVEPLRSEPRQTTDDEFLLRRRRRPHLGSLESEEAPRALSSDARRVRRRATPRRARFKRALESGTRRASQRVGPRARRGAPVPRARQLRERDLAASGHVPADLAAWTRAAEACERESPGTGRFWQNVGACLAETRRRVCQGEEDTDTDTDTDTDMDPERVSSARRVRAGGVLGALFVAARVWRSAEKEDSHRAPIPDIGGSRNVFGDWTGRTFGARRPDSLGGARVARGFELLEASPAEDNDAARELDRRRARRRARARVAAVRRAAAAAWELWRRVACAGAPPPRGPGRRRRRRQKMKTARARNPGGNTRLLPPPPPPPPPPRWRGNRSRSSPRRPRRAPRGSGSGVRGVSFSSSFPRSVLTDPAAVVRAASARRGPRRAGSGGQLGVRVGAGRARRARQRRVRRARLPPRPREGSRRRRSRRANASGTTKRGATKRPRRRRTRTPRRKRSPKKRSAAAMCRGTPRRAAAVRHRAAAARAARGRVPRARYARPGGRVSAADARRARAGAVSPRRIRRIRRPPAAAARGGRRARRLGERRRRGHRREAFAASSCADVLAREGEAVIDGARGGGVGFRDKYHRVFGTRDATRRARWPSSSPRRRQPRRPCSRRSWRPARSLRARAAAQTRFCAHLRCRRGEVFVLAVRGG